jgi:hypothetical protein
MSGHTGELSPDFAERVLQLADRRLAERRRVRCLAGAAALSIAALMAVSWIDLTGSPPPAPRNPEFVSAPAPSASGESPGGSADALSYLFPDAEPLARFAAKDGEDKDAAGAGALLDDDD